MRLNFNPFLNTRFIAVLCAVALLPGNSLWAETATASSTAPATTQDQSSQTPPLPPAQMDSIVAPVALYPDSLLSQILVASTYPLEIVQAQQWLQQHPDLKGESLTSAAQQQNWDPSIQALVIFPDVMKRLSQDITWTTNLGNAFLGHQQDVMDSVQRLRTKAEQAGKLATNSQQKVTTTNQDGQSVVEIEPANPQVVYVPYYDPAVIWGPDYYYPYPVLWYPPEVTWGAGVFWFGTGIFLGAAFAGCCGWGGWGWRPAWRQHTVIVNNYFFHRYDFHSHAGARARGEVAWHHDAVHRLGVAYPNRSLAGQYRASPRFHPSVAQVQGQFHSAAVHRVGGVDRIGNRTIGTGPYSHNRSAFGGVEAGNAARFHSNRGFSSLGHTRGAGAPAGGVHGAAPSGGAHGGASAGGAHGGGAAGHAGGAGHGGGFGGHGSGGGHH
jgi:hypothetical protein